MASEFKSGDIVQLKSGGPKMTVDQLFGDGTMRVRWFAGSKMETAVVTTKTIEQYVEPTKPAKP